MIAEALELVSGQIGQLAKQVGVSRSALFRWAKGERTPSRENLRKLADALESRADVLERRGGELSKVVLKLRAVADHSLGGKA